MLYKLLGILVWNGAKTLLRAKYGRTYMPARVLVGAVVVAGAVVGLVFAKRDSATSRSPAQSRAFPDPPMRLGPSAAVTESIPASILDGLTLEAVEWLPSGADTGLLRVRGRWAVGVGHPLGLPVLCAAAAARRRAWTRCRTRRARGRAARSGAARTSCLRRSRAQGCGWSGRAASGRRCRRRRGSTSARRR